VTLRGYHYHNNREAFRDNIGAQYVRNTLIDKLRSGDVLLPSGKGDEKERVTMNELGISYPVLVNPGRIYEETLQDPYAVIALEAARGVKAGSGAMPGMGGTTSPMGGTMPGTTGKVVRPGASGTKGPMPGMPGSMPVAMPASMPGQTPGSMPGQMPGMPSRTGARPRSATRPGSMFGEATAAARESAEAETTFKVRRFDFVVQFVWRPTTPSERHKKTVAGAQASPGQQPPVGQESGAGQPAAPSQPPSPGQPPATPGDT
jgi:hypothetical protein